jgi:PDZ domain-containing protein
MRRQLTPARLGVAGLVLLVAVVVAVLLSPVGGSYIFLPDRAHALAPLVTVEGADLPEGEQGDAEDAGIYFVDVIVRRATLLERLFPSIREGATLVDEHAVNPTGIPDSARRQGSLRQMSRSQEVAAAVALRHLGYDVKADPEGAFVSQVLPGTPAAGKVHPSDVILAVDGVRTRTLNGLRERISAAGVGATLEVEVRRGDEELTLALETVESEIEPGRPVIGVLVEQEADIELPLEVEIDAGNVGGPSAGLAFALQLLEEFGRDIAKGRRVAATGELALDGTVTSVGGVPQKTIGARRTGIDVFVVPRGENAEAARRDSDGLEIIPVRSFQQALQALATSHRNVEKD